jgi:hypothetical protein
MNVLAINNVYLTCLNIAPPLFAKDFPNSPRQPLTRVAAIDHT